MHGRPVFDMLPKALPWNSSFDLNLAAPLVKRIGDLGELGDAAVVVAREPAKVGITIGEQLVSRSLKAISQVTNDCGGRQQIARATAAESHRAK